MANKGANEWFKNVAKSIGYIAQDTVSEHLSSTFDFFSSNAEAIREDIGEAKSAKEYIKMKTSFADDYIKAGKNAIKYAKEDLKSGKIYNRERIEKSALSDMDDDGFFDDFEDFDFDDSDLDIDIDDDGDTKNIKVEKTLNVNKFEANISEKSPLVKSVRGTTDAIYQTAEASNKLTATLFESTINTMGNMGASLSEGLSVVNSNLSSMITFQNSVLGSYIESSNRYYEESLKLMAAQVDEVRKMTTLRMEEIKQGSNPTDVFLSSGGLDVLSYKNLVGKQLEAVIDETPGLSMIKALLSDKSNLEAIIASPLKVVADTAVQTIIPTVVKESMASFDRTFSEFFPALLSKVAGLKDSDNPLLSLFGRVFGVEPRRKSNVDLGNYERGAVPFDGYVRKSIVEVIPGYLRKIEAALTGGNERGFDFSTGTFRDAYDMKNDFSDKLRKEIISSFNDARYDLYGKARKIRSKDGVDLELTDKIDRLFEIIANDSSIRGVTTSKDKKGSAGYKQLSKVLTEHNYKGDKRFSEEDIEILTALYNTLDNSKKAGINGRMRFDAAAKKKRFLEEAELNPYESNANYAYGNLDVDKGRTDKSINWKNKGLVDRWGNNQLDYLRDIKEILLTGIKVFPAAGIAGDGVSSGPSLLSGYSYDDVLENMRRERENLYRTYDRATPLSAEREAELRGEGTWIYDPNDHISAKEIERKINESKGSAGVTNKTSVLTDAANSIINGKFSGQKEKLKEAQETYNNTLASIQSIFEVPSRMIKGVFDKMDSTLYKILFGAEDGEEEDNSFVSKTFNLMRQKFTDFSEFLKEKLFGEEGVFSQIKQSNLYQKLAGKGKDFAESLLGEKDADGIRSGGILSETANELSDTFRGVTAYFTGKEWIDSKGFKHDEDSNAVFPVVASTFNSLKDNLKEHLFGESELDENGNKKGIITSALDHLSGGFDVLTEALFGPKTYKGDDGKTYRNRFSSDMEDFNEKLKERAPKSIAWGTIGGAAGLLGGITNVGLLGSLFLPGGPVGMAIIGGTAGWLSQSDKFKTWLFGEKDPDGNRLGGFISAKTQEFFKENKVPIVGGAVLGSIKGMIGGGFLASTLLPGGPIGGALMGIGASLITKSNMFQEFLYGPKDADGLRKSGKGILGTLFGKKQGEGLDKKAVGAVGAGALSGAALAGIISNFGIMGAALTPLGPLGGALAGAAVGLLAASDKWKEKIFGKLNEDTGEREGGLLGQFQNWAKLNIFAPVKLSVQETTLRVKEWFMEGISLPLQNAVDPLKQGLIEFGTRIVDTFKTVTGTLVTKISSAIETFTKSIFGKLISGVGKLLIKGVKGMVTAPLKLAGNVLTAPFKLLEKAAEHKVKKDKKNGLKYEWRAKLDEDGNEVQDDDGNTIYEKHRRGIGTRLRAVVDRDYRRDLQSTGGQVYDRDGKLVAGDYISDWEYNRDKRKEEWATEKQRIQAEIARKRIITDLVRNKNIDNKFLQRGDSESQNATDALFDILNMDEEQLKENFGDLIKLKFNKKGKLKFGRLSDEDKQKILDRAQEIGHEKYVKKVEAQKDNFVEELPTVMEQTNHEVALIREDTTGLHQQLSTIREYFSERINPIIPSLEEKIDETNDYFDDVSNDVAYMRNDLSRIVSILERRFNIQSSEISVPPVRRRVRSFRRTGNRKPPSSSEEAASSDDDDDNIIDLSPDEYNIIDGGEGGFGVPYFSQMDSRWASKNYNRFGKFGLTGCGPTAMAMVAGGFGTSASPYDMAKIADKGKFNDHTGTNWKFVGSAAKAAGLKTRQQLNPSRSFIDGQLSQGKPVLLSGRGGYGTPYTSAGHYVVATGKDANGNPIINDPRGEEYSGVYDLNSTLKTTNSAWSFDKGSGSSLTHNGGGFGEIEDEELLNKKNLVEGMSEALDDSDIIKKNDTIKVKIVSSDIPIGGVGGGSSVFASDSESYADSTNGVAGSGPFAYRNGGTQSNIGSSNPFAKNRPQGTLGGLFSGLGAIASGAGNLVNKGVNFLTGGKSSSLGSWISGKLSNVPILGTAMKVGSGLLNAGKSAINGLSNFFDQNSSSFSTGSQVNPNTSGQLVTSGAFENTGVTDTRAELMDKGSIAGNPNLAAQSRILKGVSLSAQGGKSKGWTGLKGESEYTDSVSREDKAHYITEKFGAGSQLAGNTINTQNNQYIYGSGNSTDDSGKDNPLSNLLSILKKGLPVISIPVIGTAALNAISKLNVSDPLKSLAKKSNEAINSLLNKYKGAQTATSTSMIGSSAMDGIENISDDLIPAITSNAVTSVAGLISNHSVEMLPQTVTNISLTTQTKAVSKAFKILRQAAKKYGITYDSSTSYSSLYASILAKEKALGIAGTSKSVIQSIPAPNVLALENKNAPASILEQVKALSSKQAEKVPVGIGASKAKNTAKASITSMSKKKLDSYYDNLSRIENKILASELEHEQFSANYQNNSLNNPNLLSKSELSKVVAKLKRIAKENSDYGATYNPSLSIEQNVDNINEALRNKYASNTISVADDVVASSSTITPQLPAVVNNVRTTGDTPTSNNAYTGTVETIDDTVDRNMGRKMSMEDPTTGLNYRGTYGLLSHIKNGNSIVTNGFTINDNQLNPLKGFGAVGLNPMYDRTGIVYRNTTSVSKALAQKGTSILAETGSNLASNGTNSLTRGAGRVLSAAGNAGTTAVEKGSKFIGAIKAADNAVGRGISTVIGGFIKLIKDTFGKWLSNTRLVKFLGKKGSSEMSEKVSKNIFSKLTEKVLQPFATKISTALGKVAAVTGVEAATLGIGTAVFAVYDGFSGALDAAHLFQVSNDDVTAPMRTISALIKILVGLGNIGPILDVLNEIISAVSGFNVKRWLASSLYEIYCKLFDKEAGEAFEAAQASFDSAYASFVEETGVNVTKDSYNNVVNQTTGSKIWSGVKSAGKNIASLWSSSEEEHYVDSNGNKYFANEDGGYTVYNSNGKKYGDTTELPENVTKVDATQKDGVLKKGAKAIGTGIATVGSTIKEKAAGGFNVLKGGVKAAGAGLTSVGSSIKEKATGGFNVLKGGVKAIGTGLATVGSNIKEKVSSGIAAFKDSEFGQTLSQFTSSVASVASVINQSAKGSIKSALTGEDKEPVELDANDPLLLLKKAGAIGGRVLTLGITIPIRIGKAVWEGVKGLGSAAIGVNKIVGTTVVNAVSNAISGKDLIEPEEYDGPLGVFQQIAGTVGNLLTLGITIPIRIGKAVWEGVKGLGTAAVGITKIVGTTAINAVSNAVSGKDLIEVEEYDGPLGVFQQIAGTVGNLLTLGISIPIRTGKAIWEGAKTLGTAAIGIGKIVGTEAVNAVSNAISGKDLIESEEYDGPLGIFQKIAGVAVNTMLTPITIPIRVGKALWKGVKTLGTAAIGIGKIVGTEAVNAVSNAISGRDLIEPDEYDGPLGIFQKIAGVAVNALLTPITTPIRIGKAMVTGVQKIWNATTAIRTFIGDAATNSIENALKGNLLLEAEYDSSDPMGGIKYAGQIGISALMAPITTPIAIGTNLVNGVKTLWEGIKSTGTFIGDTASEIITNASKGEFTTLEYDSSDPMGGIKYAGQIGISALMTPLTLLTIGTHNIVDGVKDAWDGLKGLGEKITEYTKYPGADASFSEIFNMPSSSDGTAGFMEKAIFYSTRPFMMLRWVFDNSIAAIGDFFSDIGENASDAANFLLDKIGLGKDYVVTGGNGGGFGSADVLNNHSYFSQNDPRWKNVKYNSINNDKRTISESGCGPASMAMVINDMTGGGTDPVTMAKLAREKGYNDETGTNWNFVSSAANEYGLSANQSKSPSSSFVDSQLSKGKPVLLSGRGGLGTPYTPSGHYVVAVGKDSNGNYIINDPRGKRYSGKYSADSVLNTAGSAWSFNGGGHGGKLVKFIKGKLGPLKMQGGGFGSIVTLTKVDKSASDAEKQAAVVATMKSLEGKLDYTQSSMRTKIEEGYADCSSLIWWIFKNVLGLSIGATSFAMETDGKGVWVDKGEHPNEANLQPGDVLIFYNHVEMYVGNGQTMGHGGGSDGKTKGPVYHGMTAFNNRKYIGAKRYVGDASNIVNSVNGIIPTSSGSDSNEVSGLVSSFGSALSNIVFGKWGFSGNPFGGSTTSASSYSSDSSLSGNSNAEKIWNYLRGKGMRPEAVAAIMGNFKQESGLNPKNLQNSYESSLGMSDESYTAAVDNGSYSRFASDSAGYGLAQWTYSSRKKNMYDYIKSRNLSIGDLGAQLDYFWKEFSNYQSLISRMNGSNSVSSNTSIFEHEFERAGTPNMPARQKYASEIYAQFGGKGGGFGSGYPLDELEKYDSYPSFKTNKTGDSNFTYSPTRYYSGGHGTTTTNKMKTTSSTLTKDLSGTSDTMTYMSKTNNKNTDDKIDKILYYLETIANNSGSSNDNLRFIKSRVESMKGDMRTVTNNTTNVITGGNTGTASTSKTSKSAKVTNDSSFYTRAKSISRGRTQ